MALKYFRCSDTLLCLNASHPAIRGLQKCCSSLSSSYAWVNHKNNTQVNTTFRTTSFSSALLHSRIHPPITFRTLGSRSSHLLCALTKGSPSALMKVELPITNQKVVIHQQRQEGDKQAHQYFILSPKGIFQASPESLKPYLSLMRLDRPIGTWLLFLPCTWSISLAAPPGCLPDFTMLALFAMGSFFMRGAGCTINDMWDKDYDAKVARTKDRPLACGQLTNFQALTFLGLQLSASLAILLTMNWNTIMLGCCAMIPVIIYPLMKRVTYWPQAFLGITLNWGVMIAWSGLHGSLELPGAVLYLSCVLWTTIYDTIYSHQDKDDDVLIGVKSTALRFGEHTKPWLFGFGSLMVAGLTTAGVMCEQTLPYYLGVTGVAAHLLYQIITVDLNNAEDCSKKFRSNRNLGIMFWAAIVMGNLLKKEKEDKKTETVSL